MLFQVNYNGQKNLYVFVNKQKSYLKFRWKLPVHCQRKLSKQLMKLSLLKLFVLTSMVGKGIQNLPMTLRFVLWRHLYQMLLRGWGLRG